MATLTADELAYIRSMLPTVASTDPAYVTDTQLNYLYTNKAEIDVDKTIAYALRQMCVKVSGLVARTNAATGDTMQSQQEREAVCGQADAWATMTGIPSAKAGALSAGVILLDIDAADDDVLGSDG